MCDFAPGERVVCVDDGIRFRPHPFVKNQEYVVRTVKKNEHGFRVRVHGFFGFAAADRFRRAEPPKARDLEAWLGQPTKFEGPLRREKVAS